MVPLKAVEYNDIIKILRSTIISHTGLANNRLLNALSVRGADLEKTISDCEVSSFNLKDIFAVFEVTECADKEYFVVYEEEKNVNSVISHFQMDLKIYGSFSHMFSQQLLSLFREDDLIQELYEQGLYLKGIKMPTSVNEFINETLWPRCDTTITVQVRMEIPLNYPVEYTTSESLVSSALIIKQQSDIKNS